MLVAAKVAKAWVPVVMMKVLMTRWRIRKFNKIMFLQIRNPMSNKGRSVNINRIMINNNFLNNINRTKLRRAN